MADKDFGVKRINLVGATGTPTITSPTDLIINANKVAISTNATVGGNLGIGTTNPTSKLWVNGDGFFTGVITATKFVGSVGFATTAINLAGGITGNVPYQFNAGITSFVTNGSTGQVLISNGNAAPSWGSVSGASGAFSGITVRDEGTQVGTGSSITTLNFVGGNINATATSGASGIATITISDNLVGTALSISGISTFTNGPVLIGSATATGTASQLLQVTGGAYVSNNLGVGVTNPVTNLEVSGNSPTLRISGTSGSTSRLDLSSTGAIKWSLVGNPLGSNGALTIQSNDIELVRVSNNTGNLGIGTTNPTSKLWVNGDGFFTGVITATKFSGQLDATSAQAQSVGFATTATNLANGGTGSLPYQNSPGITSFLSGGGNNQVLLYDTGTNKPKWGDVSGATGAFGGIDIKDEDSASVSGIKILNFRGRNITAVSDNVSGISTITVANDYDQDGATSAYATKRVLQYNETTKAVTYSNTLDAVSAYITGYGAEIHVSPVAFDDNGKGTIGDPVKTIARAQVLAALAFETTGAGSRKTIVLHPGDYPENVTINTQYTVLRTDELVGKNTTLTGTLTIATGCTIDGLKMNNLVISATSATGSVDIIGCTVSTSTTKTSSAYVNFRACDLSTSTLGITSTGSVVLVGGNYGSLTVNNAAAGVLVKAVVTMGPVTLTAGTLQISDTLVYSATNTSNAITQSAGSVLTLNNSQTLIPALTNVSRNSFGGFYSILHSVYDRPNSTFGGTSLNAISYSQYINADKFITQGGTSSQFVKGDGTLANSVALGSDTTGDYVQTINGTSNQITVTGATGEGSTPTVGFVNSPTIQGTLQVNTNLNVNGNITVGGTASTLFVNDLFVFDKNIVLGIGTTNSSNADITTDYSANGGGIAIASTEGNPLVSFDSIGINTYSINYKQIAWFKVGTFAGLGTDAWLSNYAIGIGSTQFPSGTRLAVGNVQFTEKDLAVVRNINATGVITANKFVGALDATSAQAQSVGFATTAINLANGDTGSLPFQNSSGITSFLSASTTPNQVLIYDTGTNKPKWGPVTGTGAISGITINNDTSTNASRFLLFTDATSGTVSTEYVSATKLVYNPSSGNLGIGTTNPTSKLQVLGNVLVSGVVTATSFVGTALSISGISTFGGSNGVVIKLDGSNGIVTSANPGFSTVTYYGDGSKLSGINASGSVSISTNTTNQVQYLTYVTGTGSTTGFGITTTGLVFNPSSGNLGIGTTVPTSKLTVQGDVFVSGFSTFKNGLEVTDLLVLKPGQQSSNLFEILNDAQDAVVAVTTSGNLGIGTTTPSSKLWVNGDGYFTGVITATKFFGTIDATSALSQSVGFATTARDVIGGIASVTSLTVSGNSILSGFVTFSSGLEVTDLLVLKAGQQSSNLFEILNDAQDVVVAVTTTGNLGIGTTTPTSKLWVNGDGYFVGVVTANKFVGTIDATSASTLNVAFASKAGIATYTSEWILGANGASDYTFTGPGFTGAVNDPTLYLSRGQQYKFTNLMGAHPFRIQSTPNGSAGTQYNDGIVNNDVSNATLTWNVQFDAPNLLYYQCTAHGSMGGKIYIIDAGIGTDISINTSGIITANSFRGDGSQLTGLTAGVSISTNTTNQSQFIPYVTGTGTTTGFGITTTGLVFNPSTGNLGIGSTTPTSKLTVQGNVLISGITTSGITRISSSIVSPNASVPVATLEAVGASSNYDIAIVPKGNGAIVANIPDGTSVGGNKRGTYAVDLQLSRNGATQVASGENSFIGNGYRNTASGWYSAVLNGSANTSSSTYSIICGGASNAASGEKSFIGNGAGNSVAGNYTSVINGEQNNAQTSAYCIIGGGIGNSINGDYSSVLCGSYNRALRKYSSVISGHWGDTRNTYGAVVFSGANESFATGFTAGGGYQQSRLAVLSKQTADATPSTLTADGNSYDGENVLRVVTKSAYLVKGSVIAYSNASDLARAWEFTAVIKNASGSPVLVGTPIINDIAYDSAASGWNLSITADSGTSSLKVEVTGQSSTTIRWVTKMDSTEVAFQ